VVIGPVPAVTRYGAAAVAAVPVVCEGVGRGDPHVLVVLVRYGVAHVSSCNTLCTWGELSRSTLPWCVVCAGCEPSEDASFWVSLCEILSACSSVFFIDWGVGPLFCFWLESLLVGVLPVPIIFLIDLCFPMVKSLYFRCCSSFLHQ
jgi:hypothetical protein